jgi:hypothetical protein
VTLLAVKGISAAFDTVELTLEGKTSAFDLAEGDGKKKDASSDEVVCAVASRWDDCIWWGFSFTISPFSVWGQRIIYGEFPTPSSFIPPRPSIRLLPNQKELHVAKTFYLYGHGTEHTTPLAITLKQGSTVVGTGSLPHDKAEATEDVSTSDRCVFDRLGD